MSDNGDNSVDKVEFDAGLQHLGDVYAKALLGAAEKAGVADEVVDQFESLVRDLLQQLPKLQATLESPRIANEEKTGILDKAFGGRMHQVLLNFLKVVVEHGRMNALTEMYRATRQQLNDARGRVEVRVSTAVQVDPQLASSLAERLSAALQQQVDLKTFVDPELLGGLVVRVGDTVYDGSVANRLTRMREQALTNTVLAIRSSQARFTD